MVSAGWQCGGARFHDWKVESRMLSFPLFEPSKLLEFAGMGRTSCENNISGVIYDVSFFHSRWVKPIWRLVRTPGEWILINPKKWTMWYTVSPLQQPQVPCLYLVLFHAGKRCCLPSRRGPEGLLLQFWNHIKCQSWPLHCVHVCNEDFYFYFCCGDNKKIGNWSFLSLRLLLESKSFF